MLAPVRTLSLLSYSPPTNPLIGHRTKSRRHGIDVGTRPRFLACSEWLRRQVSDRSPNSNVGESWRREFYSGAI